MNTKDEGRVPALKLALFLIFATAVIGSALIIYGHFAPGALLFSTACLSMTLLARP